MTEVLTGSANVMSRLRLPATSVIQQQNNMSSVFSALKEGGCIIDASVSDIVLGHRERTLGMLWQVR